MTLGVTFSLKFPQYTMEYGGKEGYRGINTIFLESIDVGVSRIIPEKTANYDDVTNCGTPFSEYMGRSPRSITLNIIFGRTSKELRAFAKTLTRQVKTVNNIFMPGMIITVTSSVVKGINIGSVWQVDTYTTDRNNGRGKQYPATLTLIEYSGAN
jgi:hypothetical protein